MKIKFKTNEANKMKKIMKTLAGLGIVLLLMVMAVASVSASNEVGRAAAVYFDNEDATKIDFEDADLHPARQYWDSHGVRIYGPDSTPVRVNDENRGGDRTISGAYSIVNDANYPATSNNNPMFIAFKEGMHAVGFYLGNGAGETDDGLRAWVSIYDKSGRVIDTFRTSEITNPVTRFFGVYSDEKPIYSVSVTYGNSALSEDIDDLMFRPFDEEVEEVEEVVIEDDVVFRVSVNDAPDRRNGERSSVIPGYINAYKVELNGQGFKVVDSDTYRTTRNSPASVRVKPGEMFYFEGFLTWDGAQEGARQKEALRWTRPPYKNFVDGDNGLCQTNFMDINEKHASYRSGCTIALTTPFQDQRENNVDLRLRLPDLDVKSLSRDDSSFVAQVCNIGDQDVSNFQIRFSSNGVDNILRYAPVLREGDCTNIYSWGYSYFGIDRSDRPYVSVKVDPHDTVEEFNENNNRYVMSGSSRQTCDSAGGDGWYVLGEGCTFHHTSGLKLMVLDVDRDGLSLSVVGSHNYRFSQLRQKRTITYGGNDYEIEFNYFNSRNDKATLHIVEKENVPEPVQYSWPGNSCKGTQTIKDGESFDFVTQKFGRYSKGHMYMTSTRSLDGSFKFYANNVGQRGVVDLGWLGNQNIKSLEIPDHGYTRYGVKVVKGHAYAVLPKAGHNREAIVFEVTSVRRNYIKINFISSECDFGNPVVVPARPVVTPRPATRVYTNPVNSCQDGCKVDNRCLPYGTRIQKSGAKFCDINGGLKNQKWDGNVCQNNYECRSNQCSNGQCVDLGQEIRETRNVLEDIFDWIRNRFSWVY